MEPSQENYKYNVEEDFKRISVFLHKSDTNMQNKVGFRDLYFKKCKDAVITNEVLESMVLNPKLARERLSFMDEMHLNIFMADLEEYRETREPTILRTSTDDRRQELSKYEKFLQVLSGLSLDETYVEDVITNDLTDDKFLSIVENPQQMLREYAPFLQGDNHNLVLRKFKDLMHERQKIEFELVRDIFEKLKLEKYLNLAIGYKINNTVVRKIYKNPALVAELMDFLEPTDKKSFLQEINERQEFGSFVRAYVNGPNYERITCILQNLNMRQYINRVGDSKLDDETFLALMNEGNLEEFEIYIHRLLCDVYYESKLDCPESCLESDPNTEIELQILLSLLHKSKGLNLVSELARHDDDMKVGSGMFGTVSRHFLMVRISIHRSAQKEFQSHQLYGQTSLDIARAELTVLQSLSHQNILQVVGYLQISDKSPLRIITEYFERSSLADFITKRKHYMDSAGKTAIGIQIKRYNRLLCMTSDVCNGMQYLHSKDYLHRDLKLDNVLLDSNFNAILVDFGTAKAADSTTKLEDSEYFTLLYMAPEALVKSEKEFTKASDVWSFGVLCYLLWTMITESHFRNKYTTVQDIKELIHNGFTSRIPPISFGNTPEYLTSEAIKDVIDTILVVDSLKRPTFSNLKTVLDNMLNLPEQLIQVQVENYEDASQQIADLGVGIHSLEKTLAKLKTNQETKVSVLNRATRYLKFKQTHFVKQDIWKAFNGTD